MRRSTSGPFEEYVCLLDALESDPLPHWDDLARLQARHAHLLAGALSGDEAICTRSVLGRLADGHERTGELKRRYEEWQPVPARCRQFAVALLSDSGSVPDWAFAGIGDGLKVLVGPSWQAWSRQGRLGSCGESCLQAAGEVAERTPVAVGSVERVSPAVVRFAIESVVRTWEARVDDMLAVAGRHDDQLVLLFDWCSPGAGMSIPLFADAVGMGTIHWLARSPRIAALRAPSLPGRWLARSAKAGTRCAALGSWRGEEHALSVLTELSQPGNAARWEGVRRAGVNDGRINDVQTEHGQTEAAVTSGTDRLENCQEGSS